MRKVQRWANSGLDDGGDRGNGDQWFLLKDF